MYSLIGVFLLVIALISVRVFENDLFYDPFLKYFDENTPNQEFPKIQEFKLYSNVIWRYVLNSTLSVIIISLLFHRKRITVSAIKIYTVFGFIFLIMFYLAIENLGMGGKQMIFYIRRFLIQPLMLLILIPSYFYILNKKDI